MTPQNRYAGTPSNHTKSARTSNRTPRIVAREGYRLPAQEQADRQKDAFRAGLLVGITVTALAMCALLWLWIHWRYRGRNAWQSEADGNSVPRVD